MAIKALTPPPLKLNGSRNFFKKFLKSNFFLNGKPFLTSPPFYGYGGGGGTRTLVVWPLKMICFVCFPLVTRESILQYFAKKNFRQKLFSRSKKHKVFL